MAEAGALLWLVGKFGMAIVGISLMSETFKWYHGQEKGVENNGIKLPLLNPELEEETKKRSN